MSDKKLWDHHQNDNRSHLIQWYPRQNKIFYKIKKLLPVWSKLLEIGFGDWYLLNKLSRFGYSVLWQDLSEKNIELTQKQRKNKNIKFLFWGNDWKLLVNDKSLDGFIASEVLEHMWDNELLFCVKEIYRSLKKWWYVFLTFPVKENLKANECICPKCWEVFHKRWHKQYWDDKKVKKIFNNFQIIEFKEFFSRYIWESILSNAIGYIMFIIRKFLDKIIDLDNKTYLLILKKL